MTINLQQIGWQQIAGPLIGIDTSNGVDLPNVRADRSAISIWGGGFWQYWTGPQFGWSGIIPFPGDYTGGVGFLRFFPGGKPGFISTEYNPSGPGAGAIRCRQMFIDGTTLGSPWWPDESLWPLGNAACALTNLHNFALQVIGFNQDPFDPNMALHFISLADLSHVWLPVSLGWGDGIESGLLAFKGNGVPDTFIPLDIDVESFLQNFGRAIFLYDASANPDGMTFHPSGNNVAGQLRYNAPASDLQGAVLDFINYRHGTVFTLPIFTAVNSNNVNQVYGPLTQPRFPNENFQSTRYFPNDGTPGYAWDAVSDLTGAQLQQFGVSKIDPIATPFGAVHDAAASVSPYRFAGAGAPDVLGIVYTPYWQGYQGAPIAVPWPEGAVSPWFGMVWNGGVYLIDSAGPPQMWALTLAGAQFAGLFNMVNWTRMG